jgi:outer membrane receptor protein involved in Fe transport
VRATGAELGLRTLAFRRLQTTVAVWGLDIASELLFVGDAGTTEASRPSRRLGIEWSSVFHPKPWLAIDADLAYSHARFRDEDPAGDHIPGAVEGVASAGVSVQDLGRFSGSLRLRYFGPRPLIEDGSVESSETLLLNARVGYEFKPGWSVAVDIFNLLDREDNDIEYFYTSRLQGEPAAGVDDRHFHPAYPFSVHVSLQAVF